MEYSIVTKINILYISQHNNTNKKKQKDKIINKKFKNSKSEMCNTQKIKIKIKNKTNNTNKNETK